jgi:hypothetical protein
MSGADRRRAAWLLLLATAHVATLTISPLPWQDEAQIVDLGRAFLDPSTGWSINWLPADRPVAWLQYLGAVLQETAYQLFAPSIAGPRLASLAGAVAASWLALVWLRHRGVEGRIAVAMASLLLLDPLFTQSYRGARVDSWVIACALAACVLLRRSAASPRAGLQVAGAAALMVVAFFIWPSAAYLIPLVAAEFLSVARRPAELPSRILAAGLGVCAGVAVCILPLAGRLPDVIADLSYSADQYYGNYPLLLRMLGGLRATPDAFVLSPVLPLLAIVGAKYSPVMSAAAVVTLATMVPGNIYVFRVIYLLPALIAVAADAAAATKYRRTATALVVVALGWAAGISLVVRPAQAWLFRDARSPALHDRAASELPIPPGARVYLGPWDFYYAGRQRQWQMVHQFGNVSDEAMRRLLDRVDVALLHDSDPLQATLLRSGWRLVRRFELPPARYGFPARPYALLQPDR